MSALLTICLTLGFLFAGQAQAPGSKREDAKKAKEAAKQETSESPRSSPTIVEQQAISRDFPGQDKDKKAEERTSPTHDWVEYANACSTAVIAFFTILLFIGVYGQITTSRTIERAWVMADVEPDLGKWTDRKLHVLQGSGTSGDSTAMYLLFVCTNAGKTPAWIDEMRAKFEIVGSLPIRPNFANAKPIEIGTIPLGMMEGGAVPYVQKLPWTAVAVGHEEMGKMNVIYGFVRYRDIFCKRRMTTFAYRMVNQELRRLENYPEYNKNT